MDRQTDKIDLACLYFLLKHSQNIIFVSINAYSELSNKSGLEINVELKQTWSWDIISNYLSTYLCK